MAAQRPKKFTDEMLVYLDKLQESGKTNMFAAAPYLQRQFLLKTEQAKDALLYWMDTYDSRHPA